MVVEGKFNKNLDDLRSKTGLRKSDNLVIAFSGGGDSTALLSLLQKWVRNDKRNNQVIAFIINHNLRDMAEEEAKIAKIRAEAMGAQAKILKVSWPGGRPKTAVQEKARNARYELLVKACDELTGKSYLFLGHNFDDQIETVLQRQVSGSDWRGFAAMRKYGAIANVISIKNLCAIRPLLIFTRQELREYNKQNALKWISDPSNKNPSFSRVRARAKLTKSKALRIKLAAKHLAAREVLQIEQEYLFEFINQNTRFESWGGLRLLAGFKHAPTGKIAETMRYILGLFSNKPVLPAEQRMALARRIKNRSFKGSTLGAARFVPIKNEILVVRDKGALLGRNNIAPKHNLALKKNKPEIWDRRFIVSTKRGGLITALAKCENDLTKTQRQLLQKIPKPAQDTVPILIAEEKAILPNFLDVNSVFMAKPIFSGRLAMIMGANY